MGTLILTPWGLGFAGAGVYGGWPGMMKGRLGGVVVGVAVAGGRRPRALNDAIKGLSARDADTPGCTAAASGGAGAAGWVYC